MKTPDPQKLEARLRQMEADLHRSPPPVPEYEPLPPALFQGGFLNWLGQLPGIGKIVVVAAIALVGLSVLRGILSLITMGISLTLVAALLYGVYKVFIAPQPPK
ncbi:hypothetical protein DO97_04195 [Neosynechococcus sphagnicola sy1]|uniref:Uncharacterized protein n=1 Tax=Neosynechococcus sphagnicola sy1 TaxID=1497020 RepID=A0A098TKP4_9CYAN|nr:hypothetical protein [Neosynechococcus sphagnicola]KGF72905.1 hypothetical protein DO97_04195 [Neosynechococcus sphagnicola sy1]